MYFHYFVIISPWIGAAPFIWTNLNTLHPRMHCAKFGWNWPCGSKEEDFFNFVNVFSLFRNYLPLEKDSAFIWTNLNPLHPRILCDKFCWNDLMIQERKIFKFVNVFSLFLNYHPLVKGRALHLNKLESPSPKDALCQVWYKLAQWFWRRRWKCEKFTTMPTTTMQQQRR